MIERKKTAGVSFWFFVSFVSFCLVLTAACDDGGGKTGVDTPMGKNLIGMFHPPAAVITDTALLATLPMDECRNGMAEMVKHAVLGSSDYLDALGKAGPRTASSSSPLIAKSVEIKVGFLKDDVRDRGPRRMLNFGHTVGHGVELASGYRAGHGTSVSIGMCAEANAAVLCGILAPASLDELETTLSSLGLATALPPGVDPADVIQAMRLDKKRENGKLLLSIPVRPGDIEANLHCGLTEMDQDVLISVLQEMAS